nr:BRO family protein [uncultured Holophaga sp.]
MIPARVESAVQTFNFEGASPVRTVVRGDEPWFVAVDVCAALDLDRTAYRRLDDDEKGVHSTHTPSGDQDMIVISESGLYTLIMRSRKPQAKPFRRWVTHEVLPAIRRTGAYAPQVPEAMPDLQAQLSEIREAIDSRRTRFRPSKKVEQNLQLLTLSLLAVSDYATTVCGELEETMLRLGIPRLGESSIPPKKEAAGSIRATPESPSGKINKAS